MSLIHKKAQEVYYLTEQEGMHWSRGTALLGSLVVANFCSSCVTMGDILTELSSPLTMGITGFQNNGGQGGSGT